MSDNEDSEASGSAQEEENEEEEKSNQASVSEGDLSEIEEKTETDSHDSLQRKKKKKESSESAWQPSLSKVVSDIDAFTWSLAGVISSFSHVGIQNVRSGPLFPSPNAFASQSLAGSGGYLSQSQYVEAPRKRDIQLQVNVPKHCDEAVRAVQEYKEKLSQQFGWSNPNERIVSPTRNTSKHLQADFDSEVGLRTLKSQGKCPNCHCSSETLKGSLARPKQSPRPMGSKYSRQTPENESMRVEKAMMRLRGEME